MKLWGSVGLNAGLKEESIPCFFILFPPISATAPNSPTTLDPDDDIPDIPDRPWPYDPDDDDEEK